MSDALSSPAPETEPAVLATASPAPGDATAVDEGSAGGASTETVDAKRFNGLMSAHQRALEALASERDQRIALESRLQDKEQHQTVTTEDNATLTEVQALRQELAAQRVATAKAQALAEFPDAAPFADLIVGNDAEQIRSVAAAIAQRMVSVKESLGVTAQTTTETEASTAPAVLETADPAPIVPVIAGGSTAPGAPTNGELLEAALSGQGMKSDQDRWDAFFTAKIPVDAQQNLA
jgi:hypothetical protein